jgi:hypothetical protein
MRELSKMQWEKSSEARHKNPVKRTDGASTPMTGPLAFFPVSMALFR